MPLLASPFALIGPVDEMVEELYRIIRMKS
jgi:hypothetical protein